MVLFICTELFQEDPRGCNFLTIMLYSDGQRPLGLPWLPTLFSFPDRQGPHQK